MKPHTPNPFPITNCPVRPFHLWDPKAKKRYRSKYYSDPKRAHMGALFEARWSSVGATIEVFNASTGKLMGQYTRKVNEIQFKGE